MHNVTFTPKGDEAEWKMIFDHLATLKVGDVVTYDELSDLLGRDFLNGRGPFHKANLQLLARKKRGLLNVRNVGYRVVTATEHEQAARDQHRFARRRLRRSRHWLTNTDRSELPPEVAERFDRLEQRIDQQIDFTRRLDQRVKRVEKALAESRTVATQGAAETNARLDRLMETLKRHGIEAA